MEISRSTTMFQPSSYSSHSSGSSRIVRVSDNLYELHRPLGNPSIQILLFHGIHKLCGDYSDAHLTTWESGDGSCIWPQTWLVEEFPGAHVLSVSYIGYLGPSSDKKIDLELIGDNLVTDLLLGNIGQVPYCPVILVGHGIGGLVIKQVCCQADQSRDIWNQGFHKAKLEKLFNNLKGMFYYATPHLGSPVVDQLGDTMGIPLLNYYKALEDRPAQLKARFDKLSELNKWLIAGMGETLPTNLGVIEDVLVPEASAKGGHMFKMVAGVDHFAISRPRSKTSESYSVLKDFLDNIARDTKEDGRVSQEENYQEMPKFVVGIDIQLKRVIGRLNEVSIVGLAGIGGIGKTTLAKAVFNEQGPDFDYSCFVSNVKLIEGDLENLKEEVWKQMHCLGKKIETQPDWSALEDKSLLLALDDISTERDGKFLSEIVNIGSAESRFILTSRDRELLGNLSRIYHVQPLEHNCAEQLFMNHALPNCTIPSFLNFAGTVKAIVKHCDGLPLTLEVLGTYLRTQETEDEWERTGLALDKTQRLKRRLVYKALPEKELQVFEESTSGEHHHKKLQDNDDMDDWFDDPITAEKMCDPVTCSDGFTYDRWTILDNGMRRSPYDRNVKFGILCDNITTRSKLFRAFPEQESQFRERRKKYREEALQHACADPVEFDDAIEKLSNVLQWLPRDIECKHKLAKVQRLLSKQSIPSQKSSLVSEQGSHLDTMPSQQSSLGSEQESLLDTIPVVMHEDVTRTRLDRERARLAAFLVLSYLAIMFYIG